MRGFTLRALVCAGLVCGCAVPGAQEAAAVAVWAAPGGVAVPVSTDEVVRKLVAANQRRAAELKGYTEEREYTVSYQGFPSLKASMTVEASYKAPSEKRFQILSQTGPKLLVDRVLKRLLESEEQAAKDPARTALTPENYTFSLQGEQVVAGRQCYVLKVEPRVPSKFLYRGTIFVDAADDAVVQIEAEPAQNPSFWIKKTEVHHTYAKTGQFWLPERNRSESAVRIGGKAVLTIDYGPYHLLDASAP